jgi:hypothetical protein
MGAIVNEIQGERSLAANSEILLWNTLLIKAFQQDPQTGRFLPCKEGGAQNTPMISSCLRHCGTSIV